MQKSPLFFWALYFLLGASFSLYPHWIYVFPLAVLFVFTKKKISGVVFFLAAFGFATWKYPSRLPEDTMEGTGHFSLGSIQPSSSPFQRSLALKGRFKSFESEGKTYTNIPCVLFQKNPPKKNVDWILEGTLQKKDRLFCVFKPKAKSVWQEIPRIFSWAHFRYQKKESVRKFFHRKMKEKKIAHFFASLATADVDDRLLALEFRKVGLGHILAISGFHFALVALLLGGIFKMFLPPRIAYGVLFFFLLFYFFYLGISPSILRAFTMISLYLLGLILRRRIDMLNLLGAALLIELFYDPLTLTQLGFQLSFLATFGIILFYTPLNRLLEHLLPKRPFFEVEKMNHLDQHAALLCSGIRSSLALNFSVLFITLPTQLFLFHEFSFLSIPYNLVIPPFLGISLFLLPLGVLLPPIATWNAKYTSWLLQLIANPPEILNYKFYLHEFPFALLILWITLLAGFGLLKRGTLGRIIAPWRS